MSPDILSLAHVKQYWDQAEKKTNKRTNLAASCRKNLYPEDKNLNNLFHKTHSGTSPACAHQSSALPKLNILLLEQLT